MTSTLGNNQRKFFHQSCNRPSTPVFQVLLNDKKNCDELTDFGELQKYSRMANNRPEKILSLRRPSTPPMNDEITDFGKLQRTTIFQTPNRAHIIKDLVGESLKGKASQDRPRPLIPALFSNDKTYQSNSFRAPNLSRISNQVGANFNLRVKGTSQDRDRPSIPLLNDKITGFGERQSAFRIPSRSCINNRVGEVHRFKSARERKRALAEESSGAYLHRNDSCSSYYFRPIGSAKRRRRSKLHQHATRNGAPAELFCGE